MIVGFGRKLPQGHMPAYSVDTEEEAEKLITLSCPVDAAGQYYAPELVEEQTLENLEAFGEKLHRNYLWMKGEDVG